MPFSFDTAKHLRGWEESAEWREWLDRMPFAPASGSTRRLARRAKAQRTLAEMYQLLLLFPAARHAPRQLLQLYTLWLPSVENRFLNIRRE
jgi:hypothetical protein